MTTGSGRRNCLGPRPTKLETSATAPGGCVDCLVNLLGTKYDHVKAFTERYQDDGFIWFLECCDQRHGHPPGSLADATRAGSTM